jgi:hypothetical protein
VGHLNPYVWGADNVRDLVKTVKLNLSGEPDDLAEAERLTRESEDRFNAKKPRKD